MWVNVAELLAHLDRISCGSQIQESIFTGGLATNALTPDHLLLVAAPPLPAVEALEDAIGVPDLALFERALRAVRVGEKGTIGLRVEDAADGRRLCFGDEQQTVRLLVADPRTIATRIEDASVEKLFEVVGEGEEITLSRDVADGICTAFSLLRADEVAMHAAPDGGTLVVGAETDNVATFALPTLRGEEAELVFGSALIDVLATVLKSDNDGIALRYAGARKPLLVRDEDYRYLISPQSRGQ